MTEISLDDRERVHVDRIVFVLDCGITINPDLVRAQVEGGLLFGLSAAAWGEVVLGDGGEIVTQNFDRYPIVRMRSVPQIEVHLIESTESPTGVGEVSRPVRRAGAGERDRRPDRHPHPPAPPVQDHQDRLERGHAMPDVTITPSENGPYIVSGPVTLTAPDGRVIEHPDPDVDVPLRRTRRTSRSATAHTPRSTSTGPWRTDRPGRAIGDEVGAVLTDTPPVDEGSPHGGMREADLAVIAERSGASLVADPEPLPSDVSSHRLRRGLVRLGPHSPRPQRSCSIA